MSSKVIKPMASLLCKALAVITATLLLAACRAEPEGKRYSVYAYNYTDYSISRVIYREQRIDPGSMDEAKHEKFTDERTGEVIVTNYSWAGSWCCRTFPLMTPGELLQVEVVALRHEGRIPIKTWAYVADFKLGVDSNVTLHIYPDWHVEIDGTAMGTAEARPPMYKPDSTHAPVIGTLIPWEKNNEQ